MKQWHYNKLYSRAIVTWLLFIPIVVFNGFIRDAVYKPFVGELTAHQISTAIASAAFLVLAYMLLKKYIITFTKRDLVLTGSMWVVLTVLFEFGIGHFIIGTPSKKLFYDYNIFEGRIWILFLLVLFLAPQLLNAMVRSTNIKRLHAVQNIKANQ